MLTTRRHFIRQASCSAAALGLMPRVFAADASDAVSFFVVGDTHYSANDDDMGRMDSTSADYNARLVDWLNRLPGTEVPDAAGGGRVPVPRGVLHAGDLIDNGDKGPGKYRMVETEAAAFVADWGLNGGDAKLKWPVREVHGNHDAPGGRTPMIDLIVERNKKRAGLANVSQNGLHYSWDWGPVHFVALGIVVGDAPEVTRKRRYAPFGSLPFLIEDLAAHVGASGRPVVLLHHVDLHRYSAVVDDEKVRHHEWDYGDARAYFEALKPYRVAATICGHTHVRKLLRWNGTPDERATDGVPFLNTDNAGHFGGPTQAFLQVELSASSLRVREFATKDGWQTGTWTPQVWTFPIATA